MTNFIHEFLPKFDLERVAKEDGRWYVLPSGRHVRSVTSILDSLKKENLQRWRERVGEVEAEKISNQAKNRGTAVHELCEKYLSNDPEYSKDVMPFTYEDFTKIKKILDNSIKKIFGIEYRLFSEELSAAGTTDLICCWNNSNAIVDFKTSKYLKNEKHIKNYFLQSTCYALMAENLYGIEIPKIVIVMSVDHEQPLIFEKRKNEFVDEVYRIFKS